MLSPPVTIGSLFSGIGGLESGLEHATGARTLWQVERESFCRDVLARHWPDAVRHDDVRTVGAELAPVDIICGGFPCQDVSLAGKRAGFAGERSSLWREYRRLVALLQPRFVFAENVPGLLTARGGRDFAEVLGDLAALGFDAEWATFRASDVGAPHRRERLFLLAYRVSGGCDGVENGASRDILDGSTPRREEGADRAANGGQIGGLADSASLGGREPQHEALSLARSGEAWAGARGRSGGGAVAGMGHGADGLPAGVARRDPDAHRWPAGRGEAQHEGEPARTSKHVPQRAAKLKALGNAVVRQQAALAWRVLYARACAGPGARESGPVSQMTLAGVA